MFKTEREELIWTGRLLECMDDLQAYCNSDILSLIIRELKDGRFTFVEICHSGNIKYTFKLSSGAYFCIFKTMTHGVFELEFYALHDGNGMPRKLFKVSVKGA